MDITVNKPVEIKYDAVYYPHDAIAITLNDLLHSYGGIAPSNNSVYNENPKYTLSAEEYIKYNAMVYNLCLNYRKDFQFKKVSIELSNCINKIYYFIDLYNILSVFGFTYHSVAWNERNLLLQDTVKATVFERTSHMMRKLLRSCHAAIEEKRYKKAAELFFVQMKKIDIDTGALYAPIELTKLPEGLLQDFHFCPVEYSEGKKLWLLPAYLIQSLGDEDILYSYIDAPEKDFLHRIDYKCKLPQFNSGRTLKLAYTPFYINKTHIMYGVLR